MLEKYTEFILCFYVNNFNTNGSAFEAKFVVQKLDRKVLIFGAGGNKQQGASESRMFPPGAGYFEDQR